MNRIVFISAGPGNPQYLLPIAHQVIAQSQILIGRPDLLDLWEHQNKFKLTVNIENLYSQLIEFQQKYELTAVLISGDATLFSMLNNFHFPLKIEIIPGISSFQYFCSRLKINWNSLKIINLHGNKNLSPFISALEQGYGMIVFTGGLYSATNLLKTASLISPKRMGALGVNLSLPKEFIQLGPVQELSNIQVSESDLALIYLSPSENKGIGFFEDEDYVRTQIPFSKKETRMMVCSLLELSPAMTVLEIGGGSGGTTIDIARRISEGILFSIEKNQEACQLIQQNSERFRTYNVKCIYGIAPNDIPQKLFDRIFIGGSGGSLSSIIESSSKLLKKEGILVMTAISLSHVTEGINIIKNNSFHSLSVFQQSISRIDPNDKNLMMKSLNPIFFIKAVKS